MFLIVSVRDHPRACGEKMNNKLICGKREGSPPRVRGKAVLHRAGRKAPGITPARAGKSDAAFQVDNADGDHPRACGEK